ncbi:hypothetical protein SAMN05444398_12627 [Roseovarius pacificus]|uniref:Uncharacterized protein n=1 Tax=Roseovarius pacificus TaxID=337701 RepID=A0A1M7KCT9_9RHOB|nr:hypothetical protein [Roseovarius pacificus]SHM62824.1 hypothetical protein SAMN05444398_12627 [Roseovarius pacificus]
MAKTTTRTKPTAAKKTEAYGAVSPNGAANIRFSNRAFRSSSFHHFVSIVWDHSLSHPGHASLRSH